MAKRRKEGSEDWRVMIGVEAASHAVGGLTDRQFRMVWALEYHARDRAFCWPGNEALAKLIGKDESKVREVLGELEKTVPPWIGRVSDTIKGNRAGFVLYRRTDPASEAWPLDRPLAEAEAEIRAARDARWEGKSERGEAARNRAPGSPETGRGGRPDSGGGGRPISGPVIRPMSKKTHGNQSQNMQTHTTGVRTYSETDMIAIRKTIENAVALARLYHGDEAASEVERNAAEIVRELGEDSHYYIHAMSHVNPNGNQKIRSFHKWCLGTARNMRDDGAMRISG